MIKMASLDFEMTHLTRTRRRTMIVLFIILGLWAVLVFAQKRPAQNVSPRRHPNLAGAQRLTALAYQRIVAAQQANEWDLGGHAAKAKELLDQANEELKQAAEDARGGKCPPRCD